MAEGRYDDGSHDGRGRCDGRYHEACGLAAYGMTEDGMTTDRTTAGAVTADGETETDGLTRMPRRMVIRWAVRRITVLRQPADRGAR